MRFFARDGKKINISRREPPSVIHFACVGRAWLVGRLMVSSAVRSPIDIVTVTVPFGLYVLYVPLYVRLYVRLGIAYVL